MIDLEIPCQRVRILQIARSSVWEEAYVDYIEAAKERPNCDDKKILILLKRTNVKRNFVVEPANTAAHHSAIGVSRRDHEAQPRCEITVFADAVTVIAQAQIEHEARVRYPLVVHESREFILFFLKHAVTNELDDLKSWIG